MRHLRSILSSPPHYTIEKVGERYWLSRNGWRQGSFASLHDAVVERQRVTGVVVWQRIMSERAA